MQHNQVDISTWIPLEYELNKTYGHNESQWHSTLVQIRAMLLDTEDKLVHVL